MFIQIVLGILVLASLVVAYFSAKTWHWAHVLVVLGVFLSAVGYLFLAAETLRINAVLRSRANQLEQQLADVTTRIDALKKGTEDAGLIGALAADEVTVPEEAEQIPSLDDLDHKLHLEIRLRGRVWEGVEPAGVDAKTGTVKAVIKSPQPSGLQPDTIVFLFEEGEPALPDPRKGPQYLGEFRVTGVADQQATLERVLPMDEYELERLAASPGKWVIHETMPVDRYSLFAGQTEEQLRKQLPEQSVKEYIRHGTDVQPDDEEWRIAGYDEEGKLLGPDDLDKAAKKVYQRRLRDYTAEFDQLSRERVLLLADTEAVTTDNERLAAALASAKELEAFRLEEQRKLRIDLAGITKERQAIERHLATVQHMVANAKQKLADTLAENSRMAGELATMQARLKEAIEAEEGSSVETPAEPLVVNAAAG